jgi:hypothetical protein
LHKEGEDIAADEYLGQPACSDWGHSLCIHEENKASKDHVYRGGKQRRCDEKKQCLKDVDAETGFMVMGQSTTNVASNFDYDIWLAECPKGTVMVCNIHTAPIINGMKYNVRLLEAWKMWSAVVTRNRRANIIAATTEGWYPKRTNLPESRISK